MSGIKNRFGIVRLTGLHYVLRDILNLLVCETRLMLSSNLKYDLLHKKIKSKKGKNVKKKNWLNSSISYARL